MSLTETFVPAATQMLGALSKWLDKGAAYAAEQGQEPDALMALRLAPDMYPLAAQIRFVSFQAQEAVYRLRGEATPEELQEVRREGWSAGELPGGLAEARKRLDEALALLRAVGPSDLDGGASTPIEISLPNGMVFDMTGAAYLRDWLLPQFYFHLSIAYGILRHHGVQLGKADYVQHMFAYLRPGTMPGG